MRAPGFADGTNPGDIVTVSKSDQKTRQAAHQKGARPEVHRCRSDLLVVPGGRERRLAAVQG
jgi:hypothetical protein